MMTPIISKILSIFVVVHDLNASISIYEERYGIGPWQALDLSDEAVPQKWVREQATNYQVRMATCGVLNVGITLVQPLDDKSVFAEALRTKGQGLFHILVEPRDGFDAFLETAANNDQPVIQSGVAATGVKFAHIDFTKDLGFVAEAFKLP